MDEIVKQCILSSESDISNDEESNYANKKMFYCVIATNSCLSQSLTMMNWWVEWNLPGENKYNKHECIIMIMYVVSL